MTTNTRATSFPAKFSDYSRLTSSYPSNSLIISVWGWSNGPGIPLIFTLDFHFFFREGRGYARAHPRPEGTHHTVN